jgi:hypothetical protein
MSIPAGVVGDLYLATILTTKDMAAQFSTAAALNCGHDLELIETDVAGVRFAPCKTMIAEDIRDL